MQVDLVPESTQDQKPCVLIITRKALNELLNNFFFLLHYNLSAEFVLATIDDIVNWARRVRLSEKICTNACCEHSDKNMFLYLFAVLRCLSVSM